MKRLFLVTALSALVSSMAVANITVQLNPSVTPTGPNFTWSYDVTLGGGETATATVPGGSCTGTQATFCGGTFFTIYDFNGYVANSAFEPSNWNVSISLVGATPTGQTPDVPDNTGVTNLSFFYTGDNITGPSDLGLFGAVSTFGTGTMGAYTEQSNSDPPGTREHGGGFTTVPAGVPEPASLALIGAGLIGLAIGRKRLGR